MCGKQYVGSTTEKFRFRWSNYKNNQPKTERDEDHTQKYFDEHFLSHNRNGLNDPSDSTRRDKVWQAKLKTLAPDGFNTEE